MIIIKSLNKSYGKLEVLKDINLELEEGKIYGLLGRNGAGKTTLLNIISNKIQENSGQVEIFGEEVFENGEIVEEIFMIGEHMPELKEMKVQDIFQMAKILHKNWDEEYKDFLIKKFKVNINQKYGKLSKGNQTIVGLILGLVSRARLTIFDEPSTGLDAAYRDEFYKLLLEDFEKYPRTVIISTHLIDEVTNLFEEIIILKDKTVFIKDEVQNLLDKAYFINGKREDVDNLLEGKRIIYRETFGSGIVLGIFDYLSPDEKSLMKDNNIEFSKMPLQKLFVYLTENREAEKHE